MQPLRQHQVHPHTDKTANTNVHRPCPSSPRQFFERLYGHLERNVPESRPLSSSDMGEGKTRHSSPMALACDSTYQSDGGSVSSPDISDERVSNSCPSYDLCVPSSFHKSNFMPTPPIPGPMNFGFSSDPHFTAGFSAFLARRRRKEGRQRRQRTTFSTEQTLRLEVEFHRNEYISRSRRFEMAETLRLTETQIKIWFQNRRAKDKRIEKAQIDQHYRNFVVANGFMSTIMGQTSYVTPPTVATANPTLSSQQNSMIYQSYYLPQSMPLALPAQQLHQQHLGQREEQRQQQSVSNNSRSDIAANYVDIDDHYPHANAHKSSGNASNSALINSC